MANLTPKNIEQKTQFIVDDVGKVVKKCVEEALKNNNYNIEKANEWTAKISETCVDELIKHRKPFKYIVTTLILQKNSGDLHKCTSSFWNQETDGSCTVRWENPTMYCMVTVYGCAV